jgi:hypothetical protein
MNKTDTLDEYFVWHVFTAGVDQGSATPIEISPDHHGYGYTVWKPSGTIGTGGPAWPSSIHGYKSWGDPSAVAMAIPTRLVGEEAYGLYNVGCSVHKTEDVTGKATTHCLDIFLNKRLHCNTVFQAELDQRNKDMRVVVGPSGSYCGKMRTYSFLQLQFQRKYTCTLVETVKDIEDCTVCQDGFEAKDQFNGKGGCVRTGKSFEGDMAPVRIYPGMWQRHQFSQFHSHFVDAILFSTSFLSFRSRARGRCQVMPSLLVCGPLSCKMLAKIKHLLLLLRVLARTSFGR